MILGRFPASDDTGPVAPASVFARVAELEREIRVLRAALTDSMRLLDSLIQDGTLTGYQAERATGRILEARQALGKGRKA